MIVCVQPEALFIYRRHKTSSFDWLHCPQTSDMSTIALWKYTNKTKQKLKPDFQNPVLSHRQEALFSISIPIVCFLDPLLGLSGCDTRTHFCKVYSIVLARGMTFDGHALAPPAPHARSCGVRYFNSPLQPSLVL